MRTNAVKVIALAPAEPGQTLLVSGDLAQLFSLQRFVAFGRSLPTAELEIFDQARFHLFFAGTTHGHR